MPRAEAQGAAMKLHATAIAVLDHDEKIYFDIWIESRFAIHQRYRARSQ
jgi:hypothetical protein